MGALEDIIGASKTKFDLTEPTDQESLLKIAEQLLAHPELTDAQLLEASKEPSAPLEFRIAIKLVKSRRFLLGNNTPVKVGIVCAMWGEQNRLHPKSESNPNGEDVLRAKLDQLKWVSEGTQVDWTLYMVDDGCPYGSGKIAEEIAKTHPLGDKAKIRFLEKVLPAESGPLAKLKSANDSQKGGAIIYGCMEAVADMNDVVIYSDTDNSVHLGQIGLLLEEYLANGKKVVLGNRKHPDAVLVKQEARWGIGIKLLRHMQRMVGKPIFSQGIKDSQAAFKLYERGVLEKIIADPTVYNFSFDTDWISAVLAMNEPFSKVPMAFVDSFAESASIEQGPMTTWIVLLKGLVMSMRKHKLDHNEEMAKVLDEEIESSADLDKLINHLPPQLENATDADFGNPDVMDPEAIRAWIKERKAN